MHSAAPNAEGKRKQLLEDLAELKSLIIKYYQQTELSQDRIVAAKIFNTDIQPLLKIIQQIKQSERWKKFIAESKAYVDKNLNDIGNNILTDIFALEYLIKISDQEDVVNLHKQADEALKKAISPFSKLMGSPLVGQILKFSDAKDATHAGSAATVFRDKTKDPNFWRQKMQTDFGFYPEIKNLGDPIKTEYLSLAQIHQQLDGINNFIQSKNPHIAYKNEMKNILACAKKIDYAPLYRKSLNADEKKSVEEDQYLLSQYIKHAIFFGNSELVDWLLTQYKVFAWFYDNVIMSGNTKMLALIQKHPNDELPDLEWLRLTPENKQQAVIDVFYQDKEQKNILPGDRFDLISSGYQPLLKHLFEHLELKPTIRDLISVIYSRNEESIKYLKDLIKNIKLEPEDIKGIFLAACTAGNEKIVNQYKDSFDQRTEEEQKRLLACVAGSGNTKLFLDLVSEKKIEPSVSALQKAAKIGDLELVKHLIQIYTVPLNEDVLRSAADSGSLELISYFAVDLNQPKVLDHVSDPMIRNWMKEQIDAQLLTKDAVSSLPPRDKKR